jgi:hypothetical protein
MMGQRASLPFGAKTEERQTLTIGRLDRELYSHQ